MPENKNHIFKKPNLRSKRNIIPIIIATFSIYIFLKAIDIQATTAIMVTAKLPLFMLAFIAYYASIPIRGYRWHILLGNIKSKVTNKSATEIWFLAYYLNCLLPAKIGDIYRAYMVKKKDSTPISKTLATIAYERLLDIIFILITLSFTAYMIYGSRTPQFIIDSITLTTVILAVGALTLILSLRFKKRINNIMPLKIKEIASQFKKGVTISYKPRQIPRLILITIFCWTGDILRIYFTTRALGLNMPLELVIFTGLAQSLLSSLPITPAGLGVSELAISAILTSVGYDLNTSASIAILDRIVHHISFIAIGTPVYLKSELSK